jgi:hypothetical protein
MYSDNMILEDVDRLDSVQNTAEEEDDGDMDQFEDCVE